MSDPVHGGEAARWGGWQWNEPRRGEHFRRCSYCGSINPDDLAAEPTWHAHWADWKYGWPHKLYVDVPNREPERLFIVSAHREQKDGPYAPGGPRFQAIEERMPGLRWVPVDELPADVSTDGWVRKGESLSDNYDLIGLGTRPNHHGKFYTVHLADPAISSETKDTIERASGLRFHFEDGTVRWSRVTEPA